MIYVGNKPRHRAYSTCKLRWGVLATGYEPYLLWRPAEPCVSRWIGEHSCSQRKCYMLLVHSYLLLVTSYAWFTSITSQTSQERYIVPADKIRVVIKQHSSRCTNSVGMIGSSDTPIQGTFLSCSFTNLETYYPTISDHIYYYWNNVKMHDWR